MIGKMSSGHIHLCGLQKIDNRFTLPLVLFVAFLATEPEVQAGLYPACVEFGEFPTSPYPNVRHSMSTCVPGSSDTIQYDQEGEVRSHGVALCERSGLVQWSYRCQCQAYNNANVYPDDGC
jgi:hypothetical protein